MLRELVFHYVPRLAPLLIAAGMLAALPGCNGGDSDGVTASKSQYAPAGREDEGEARRSAAVEHPADGKPAAGQDAQRPAPKRPQAPAGGRDPLAGAQQQPPISYEVPEGGPPELFAYIDRLNERLHALIQQRNMMEQQGQQTEALVQEVDKNLSAQVAAAEKVLAANPDEETRIEAVQNKARAIQARFQMGFPGAEERLNRMIEDLANDPDEDMQRIAVVYRLTIPMVKVQTGELEESEPLVAALDTFLETAEKDAEMFGVAVEAVGTLQTFGSVDETLSAMRSVSKAFQVSEEQQVEIAALQLGQQVGEFFERAGRTDEAGEVYATLLEQAAKLGDSEARNYFESSYRSAMRRVGMVGKEVKLEDLVDAKGEPINWSDFRGKVVLLDFWATWCKPCIEEFPNIAQTYKAYKDDGFEVIGINMDESMEELDAFLQEREILWITALHADPEQRGPANPVAESFGVEKIPFMVLVDQEGKVAAIHTRGARLEEELRKLLNLPEDAKQAPAGDQPEGDTPPAVKEEPADAAPAEEAPGGEDSSGIFAPGDFYVALLDEDAGDEAEDASPAAETPARNPYLAEEGLSTLELVEFLLDMEDKPLVIQQRPGFAEAIAEAADRILADEDAREKYQVLAALAKIKHLHERASFGDEKADASLAAFVEKLKDDPREKIAAEVKLLTLERRALEAENLEEEQIEVLLAELKSYFEEHRETLSAKHLRMASAAVGAVNQIEDGDAREEHFNAFGSLFAASSDPELARYGKRLAAEAPASSLVGKTLELSGATELGTPLDWEAYRGKVVVVDFWATWCGPCRRATPAVKAFHKEHRDAGFDVVGVNLDRDSEALAQYIDENKLPWSNIVGEDAGALAKKCGVRGIPTFVLVSREGKVLEVGHSFETLQEKIEELLKAS